MSQCRLLLLSSFSNYWYILYFLLWVAINVICFKNIFLIRKDFNTTSKKNPIGARRNLDTRDINIWVSWNFTFHRYRAMPRIHKSRWRTCSRQEKQFPVKRWIKYLSLRAVVQFSERRYAVGRPAPREKFIAVSILYFERIMPRTIC